MNKRKEQKRRKDLINCFNKGLKESRRRLSKDAENKD